MATIEDIKVYINAIISNAERLTSGNVSHNGAAIQIWANMALSDLDEVLTEQDRIARAEERERCIKVVQECYCKSRCSFYKNGECELAENFDKVGATCIFHSKLRKAIKEGGDNDNEEKEQRQNMRAHIRAASVAVEDGLTCSGTTTSTGARSLRYANTVTNARGERVTLRSSMACKNFRI